MLHAHHLTFKTITFNHFMTLALLRTSIDPMTSYIWWCELMLLLVSAVIFFRKNTSVVLLYASVVREKPQKRMCFCLINNTLSDLWCSGNQSKIILNTGSISFHTHGIICNGRIYGLIVWLKVLWVIQKIMILSLTLIRSRPSSRCPISLL